MAEGAYFFPVTVPYQGPGRNQSYGQRTSGRMHEGVDFTPPVRLKGEALTFPILAYRGGKVVEAQNGHGYGWIKIQHEDGTFARYLHNSSVQVVVDALVTAGQQIANMGGRGPSGATQYPIHLHFELLDAKGKAQDPHAFLLDGSKNPLGTLVVVSHPTYGPPASEGGGV
jgi:putative chitinase